MSKNLLKAKNFASDAHKRINHKRKYSDKPYVVHLKAVASLVATVTDDEDIVSAAWLHDIVEDTPCTHTNLENEFGRRIADFVYQLTDVSKPSDGNRSVRKKIDLDHISKASPEAKTVKLADLIDNLNDIAKHDQKFFKVFMKEAIAYLDVLNEGDQLLYSKFQKNLYYWAQKLSIDIDYLRDESLTLKQEKIISFGKDNTTSLRSIVATFSAEQILNPLLSHDNDAGFSTIKDTFKEAKVPVIGIRKQGKIAGYISEKDVKCENKPELITRLFSRGQIITPNIMLTEVVNILGKHEFCFIQSAHGNIIGYIDKSCIEKPISRMWLFGIISLIESVFQTQILTLYPNNSWTKFCTNARLEKANELFTERHRINQNCQLVECLQFSDKARIISQSKLNITQFGTASKREADRKIKALESLRNNLAHSQPIVTHDWAQIITLTKNMQNLFN